MPEHPDLPEEAVRLARSAAQETSTDPVLNIVEHAAPAIRKQERERVREALIGPKAMLAWQGRGLIIHPEDLGWVFVALDQEASDG